MNNEKYNIIIIGSGPAGLGAAFHLARNSKLKILIIDKRIISSGGLRNDCKQNYTFPVGFPEDIWNEEEASALLKEVERELKPDFMEFNNIKVYRRRAEKLGAKLLKIRQAHVGTDNAAELIHTLTGELKELGVVFSFKEEALHLEGHTLITDKRTLQFDSIITAPGRAGFSFLQKWMDELGIEYIDNIVDIGIRLETKEENYPIVRDYYDPKFIFPNKTRTFCTNSGAAYVVKEKYDGYYSVNGHSFSKKRKSNGLVNFAVLRTIRLTDPIRSGQEYASILGKSAMQVGGGNPIMQRTGDFRMDRRSKFSDFNEDLYNFKPTLNVTPGDIALTCPAKILREIWKSLKKLDTIVPGILHPSTIIYYPEIKMYANRPVFIDNHFAVKENIYFIGDGAGTSRGITASWASGIRAAEGILKNCSP
ncbi:MAG: FAD-dependent oxidoreductase [Spirochaetes bacterium]|nr:FAD-dependent oxidoreductase [Spirochaetota bacterium]